LDPPSGEAGSADSLAITSLVLGIASIPLHWCCYLGWPVGIGSIVCGALALGRISREPGRRSGKAFAWTGIAASVVGFVLIVAFFVIYGAAMLYFGAKGSP